MNKFMVLLVLIVPLILSCAGLPQPKTHDDTLVIGSLALDFPDGFFDSPPRTITTGIEIVVVNKTREAAFSVLTVRDGYFYFLTNGRDSFSLDRYSYEATERSGQRVFLKSELRMPIEVVPGRVRYIGKLIISYRQPQRSSTVSERKNLWNYQPSVSLEDQKPQMIEHLKAANPESPWLSYEVVQ